MPLSKIFINALVVIFKAMAGLFKVARGLRRKDTPAEERALFSTLMTWSVVVLICLIIAILAGWEYVFKAL